LTTTINASTVSGLVQTADTSGSLALQTASTTALTLDTSQNATFAGSVKTNTLTSAASTALTLQSAGTTAVTIDTSQRVLIGTTSASYGKLVISGTSADVAMQIADTASTTAGIGFNGSGSTNGVGAPTGTLYFGQYNGFPMVFTNNNAERMRIDSSGNLLVGTTSLNRLGSGSPSTAVQINATSGPEIYISTSSTTSGDSVGSLNFGTTGASSSTKRSAIIGSELTAASGTNVSGNLVFYTNNAGSLAERMRINSGGDVMIGTTSLLSAGKLSVSFDGGTRQGATLRTTIAGTGSTYMQFENSAGATAGYIIHNGTTTVSYVTSSDYRLKEAITPMTGALDKVARLKPVTYKWKSDGSDGEGFIAHELAEVCPIAVTREKDQVDADGNPQYQGIDTSFLVATLTAAIQELKAINDTQAETINALTARIVALEGR